MTGEGIYLIQEDGGLLELSEQPYESEELLQQLLERYPSLLAGREMSPAEPRRWVLVTREAGMPSRLGGGAQRNCQRPRSGCWRSCDATAARPPS